MKWILDKIWHLMCLQLFLKMFNFCVGKKKAMWSNKFVKCWTELISCGIFMTRWKVYVHYVSAVMELDSNFLHSQSSISCESAKSMLSPNWKRERETKSELWGWRHSRVSFKKAVSRWAVWDQQVFQEMDSEVSRQNRHTEALESLMMVWVPA